MYSTGSIDSTNSLMLSLRDFCQTAGYTINSLTDEGTGKRLHISKNNRFFNLRSFNNESVVTYSNNQYAIFMNASTSYNAGNTWYQQPNYFDYNDGSTKSFIAGIINLESGIRYYHFFHFNTANYDVIYVFLENGLGYFQRLLFGNVSTEKFGTSLTTAEGMFYSGSKAPFNKTYSNAITIFGDGIPEIYGAEVPQSAIYIRYSGTPRWHSGNFNINQAWMSPQRPQAVDSICKRSTILNNCLSTFSSIPTFIPIEVYAGQDTGNITNNITNLIPFGELPEIYFTRIDNFTGGGDLKMAKDTYKIFPFSGKNTYWDSAHPEVGTYQYGLAVRKA
jgi:hypothetical protein